MTEAQGFLRSLALDSYALVTDGGDPQLVLDAIPEIDTEATAAEALGFYGGICATLAAIGKADGIVMPNASVFQPQKDGTVRFVPPVEPEPEP